MRALRGQFSQCERDGTVHRCFSKRVKSRNTLQRSCTRTLPSRQRSTVCSAQEGEGVHDGHAKRADLPQNAAIKRGTILGSASDPELPAWRAGIVLVQRTAQLVWANAWAVLALFAACDGLVFVLHRFSHRLTNEVALRFLLDASRGQNLLNGNLWYLTNNSEIANFQTGYQWVVGIVFLLVFPITILLRTLACASTQVLLLDKLDEESTHPGWLPQVRSTVSETKQALAQIRPLLSRLWQVDLLVAVRSIPLQGLSLFLLPLPWTLPRLLNLQLAAPIALFQGEEGDAAIKQSAKQIQPARKAFAFPFLGLLVTSKLLGFLGRMILMNLDPRITVEIPEIPIAIYALIAVSTVILHRVQDLLPFVLYSELKSEEGGQPTQLKPAS